MAYAPEVICGGGNGVASGIEVGWGNGTAKPSMATPPGLKGLKTTFAQRVEATGLSSRAAGVKVQVWTAVCAALVRGGTSRRTWTFTTFPVASRFRSSVTIPGVAVLTG